MHIQLFFFLLFNFGGYQTLKTLIKCFNIVLSCQKHFTAALHRFYKSFKLYQRDERQLSKRYSFPLDGCGRKRCLTLHSVICLNGLRSCDREGMKSFSCSCSLNDSGLEPYQQNTTALESHCYFTVIQFVIFLYVLHLQVM